jgi:hypothetical protein
MTTTIVRLNAYKAYQQGKTTAERIKRQGEKQ